VIGLSIGPSARGIDPAPALSARLRDRLGSRATAMTLVRPATPADLPTLGLLAAQLVRQHHGFDARRFFLIEPIEEGYARWLGREMNDPGTVIMVAEQDDAVVGYTYGSLQERDWNALLDACGAIHDVYIDARARRGGVATKLVQATLARFTELGVPRVVLSTAAQNEPAQRFFERLGFRRTMIEYTRESDQ
jgi:ribosomal protein S18 acetylase RimI-like enzyme